MRNILIFASIVFFFSACAPKITSQKSPMLDIYQSNCFIFPSKEYLVTKSISEQKLYKLTEKVLDSKAYKVYYGNNKECKNYLLTNYEKTSDEYIETTKGTSITNTYGNINTNIYQYGYIPIQSNSYTFTTPDITQKVKRYTGTYSLNIGIMTNDKIATVWEGKQSGEVIDGEINIKDSDYQYVETMVTKMLEETKINLK